MQRRKRVLVIGMDGATLDLIQRWSQQGLLPTFTRMMATGAHGPLRSTIPPHTGPAWTSFITGKNPGKHGIYDFVLPSVEEYRSVPINAAHRTAESLWSILSRAGKKVGTFMVPVTYPAEAIDGFMVTGLLTPADAHDSIYPSQLRDELHSAVPGLTIGSEKMLHPLGREHQLLEEMQRMTERTMQATEYLMDRYDWDFFMMVFSETDLAIHWLWRFMDPEHPRYTSADERLQRGIQDVYQRMDRCLATLLERVGNETLVILMSDHGAGPLHDYFHVNSWLVQEGLMRFKRDFVSWSKRLLFQLGMTPANLYRLVAALNQDHSAAQTVKQHRKTATSLVRRLFLSFANVDWPKTLAYSLGNYGQIYLNVKGREPQGSVAPGAEYKRVLAEIADRLHNLTDPRTGQRIEGHIYRGDEIYQGDNVTRAPDLIFLPHDLQVSSFGADSFLSNTWLAPTFAHSGGHRMDGVCVINGPGVRSGATLSGATIADLTPTILAALGVPIPDDMDGKLLESAFTSDYFDDRPVTYVKADATSASTPRRYSAAEEEEIKERLKGLGYMA